MIEKKITLTDIDPVEIYGVNNKLFDQLVSHFPKIKAFARGSEIMVMGADEDISVFETKLNSLIAKRMTKSSLTPYDVDDLFEHTAIINPSRSKKTLPIRQSFNHFVNCRHNSAVQRCVLL